MRSNTISNNGDAQSIIIDLLIKRAPAFPGVLPQYIDLCKSRAQLKHIANQFRGVMREPDTRKAYEQFAAALITRTGDFVPPSGDDSTIHPLIGSISLRVPLDRISPRDLKYLLQILWSEHYIRRSQIVYQDTNEACSTNRSICEDAAFPSLRLPRKVDKSISS
jgi:hypothetical protein